MAKKGGSGNSSESKGERRSSISTKNTNLGQKMLNKLDALLKGKDVVMTNANPHKSETNRPFIKTRISGKTFLAKRQGKL